LCGLLPSLLVSLHPMPGGLHAAKDWLSSRAKEDCKLRNPGQTFRATPPPPPPTHALDGPCQPYLSTLQWVLSENADLECYKGEWRAFFLPACIVLGAVWVVALPVMTAIFSTRAAMRVGWAIKKLEDEEHGSSDSSHHADLDRCAGPATTGRAPAHRPGHRGHVIVSSTLFCTYLSKCAACYENLLCAASKSHISASC
jgi:hypothetical protein